LKKKGEKSRAKKKKKSRSPKGRKGGISKGPNVGGGLAKKNRLTFGEPGKKNPVGAESFASKGKGGPCKKVKSKVKTCRLGPKFEGKRQGKKPLCEYRRFGAGKSSLGGGWHTGLAERKTMEGRSRFENI